MPQIAENLLNYHWYQCHICVIHVLTSFHTFTVHVTGVIRRATVYTEGHFEPTGADGEVDAKTDRKRVKRSCNVMQYECGCQKILTAVDKMSSLVPISLSTHIRPSEKWGKK